MLSILCVRLTIKVKVGIPDSFKVGWYPPPQKKKKTGSSHLKYSIFIYISWFAARMCRRTCQPLAYILKVIIRCGICIQMGQTANN